MNATIELLKLKANLKKSGQHKFIKEQEVLNILGDEFPAINSEFERMPHAGDVYKSVKCFADFTKRLVFQGNLKEVKHCFNVAENMLRHGNKTVRNAIENVYIFSMSSIIDFTNPVSVKVKALLNESLKREYNKQLFASGL